MANNSRGRTRPSYMLLFAEQLVNHNNTQPKYAPGLRRKSPPKPEIFTPPKAKPTTGTTKSPSLSTAKPRPLIPGVSTKSASGSSRRDSSSADSSARASSTQASAISRPGSDSRSPGVSETSLKLANRPGISGAGYQIREPHSQDLATADVVRHPASEQFNQSSRAPSSPRRLPTAVERDKSSSQSTSSQRSGRQVEENQPSPKVLAQVELQQLLNKTQHEREQLKGSTEFSSQSSLTDMGQKPVIPTPPVPKSPAARPSAGRSPQIHTKAHQVVKNARGSGPPGLSQTPAAIVGGSGSFGTSPTRIMSINAKNLKTGFHAQGQKKMSLSKIIAEQTPDATKTLGPGFHVGAPGEKSSQPNEKASGTLDAVPSDYEHIFHYPSNIVDDKVQHNKNTNKKHHDKNRGKDQKR